MFKLYLFYPKSKWLILLGSISLASSALSNDGPASNSLESAALQATNQSTLEYWSPERMKSAIPMDVPYSSGESLSSGSVSLSSGSEPAGYAPGWDSNSGKPQPGAKESYQLNTDDAQGATSSPKLSDLMHGSAPTNPAGTDYPPFQRWTWNANYTVYPVGTVGKLFFQKANNANFVCSASVIHRNTLATAGHCVSQGNGVWHKNWLFCPSYWKGAGSGAPNSNRGCWAASFAVTSWQWHNVSNIDRDYACIVTNKTGTVQATSVGNVTGWLGRAWNWGSDKAELAFGYPAASPFPGYNIITASSTEWYTSNRSNANEGTVNLVSKYIGNDMTGGSSGGPWILGFNHKNKEFPDTDGKSATDSGFNWINGVNSHKRCKSSCFTPPTGVAGTYWQEMGSPQFTKSSTDNNDSEDVFAVCFNGGGT